MTSHFRKSPTLAGEHEETVRKDASGGDNTSPTKPPGYHALPTESHVAIASEQDLSLSTILKGSAANPLTTFERKAALING